MSSSQTDYSKMKQFQIIFESIPTSLLIVNDKGRIKYINRQSEKLFGYTRKELLEKDISVLIPDRFRKNHAQYHQQFFREPTARPMGEGRDLYALNSDGNEFPVEIALTPLDSVGDKTVLVTVLDLSYRKKIEEALKENEDKLQAIIENSPDSVFIFDAEGRILSMNKQAGKTFGSEKMGTSIWKITPPEKRESFSDILDSVKNGIRFVDRESQVLKPDGDLMPASISLYYIEDGYGIFVKSIRDISDRVNLRNRIVEYEKNRIVAKMSEGIAHHMGTPLASMLLRVQMMKEDISGTSGNHEHIHKLESIEKQIHYGQKIMQKLLKFASSSFEEKKVISLSTLIHDSVDIIGPLWSKSNIDFKYYQDEEFSILADSDMIKLVLSDLLMNATDALADEKDGRIDIEVLHNESSDGMILIRITDNGSGIPRDVLPHIFEPFFTTKPAGKGTGLGLSVAKTVIHDHNGEINIESRMGEGTSVNIFLPASNL